MREIFEKEEMTDIGGKQWKTSREYIDTFDETLERVDAVCKELKAFRDSLII